MSIELDNKIKDRKKNYEIKKNDIKLYYKRN